MRSDAYGALRIPGPAMPFLRWALILRKTGDPAGAAEATLQAAWALDDVSGARQGRDAGQDASELRREAVRLWGEPADVEDALRQIDVLRRAGAFDAALARAATLSAGALDENSGRILAFQQERLAEGDRGRHLISSALRPPARTPHVTHGQRPGEGGFWRRLFGG